MIGGKASPKEQVLWLQIIKFLHSPPTEEEVVLLPRLRVLPLVVNLAQSVSPSNIAVVFSHATVDLVLEWALLMQGNILEVYVRPNWIALVHHLDLLIVEAEVQKLLRVGDVGLNLLTLDGKLVHFFGI
jgi:hypothetical protein